MRVLAALSGGVDSAVAAARAVDAGHDVVAVHLALSEHPQTFRSGARGCCSIEDSRDARRVADVLGLPFYVWDLAERFRTEVVDDFVAEYAAGRTPNPCLRCNERIKFAAVADRAVALGFDAVCTGHYARTIRTRSGVQLHRAVDADKDQSYVLAVLDAAQLARALFPLGPSTKPEVRAEAAARGLLVADKPDSHDICFVADGDTEGFLARRLGARPGQVVDESGTVLGTHRGTYAFTVGQRRGLHLGVPAGDGRPRYVLGLEPATSTVTVGSRERLAVGRIEGSAPRWSGDRPAETFACQVQVRAHGSTVEAHAALRDLGPVSGPASDPRLGPAGHPSKQGSPAPATSTGVVLVLAEPAESVAPGQAAVMYDGSRVIGSVTIERTAAWA